MKVGEEVAHPLALTVEHRQLRIADHRVVEITAQGDDEAARVKETVVSLPSGLWRSAKQVAPTTSGA